MTVKKFADISTTHLCLKTLRWLESFDWNKPPMFGAGMTGYGFFLWCATENEFSPSAPHAPEGQFPTDLWTIFKFCRSQLKCDYVMLDCDADEHWRLPVFDHLAETDAEIAARAETGIEEEVSR